MQIGTSRDTGLGLALGLRIQLWIGSWVPIPRFVCRGLCQALKPKTTATKKSDSGVGEIKACLDFFCFGVADPPAPRIQCWQESSVQRVC